MVYRRVLNSVCREVKSRLLANESRIVVLFFVVKIIFSLKIGLFWCYDVLRERSRLMSRVGGLLYGFLN